MTDKPLSGQRALITGASAGIGEAIARGFADAGAAVLVNHFGQTQAADAVVQSIVDGGGRAVPAAGDVSKAREVEHLFDIAEAHFGGVDILVVNAGRQDDAAFTELTLDQWRAVLDLDLGGAFLCAQEATRRFRRQGIDPKRSQALGKIVIVSSVHQFIPWAGHANYAAAKGGIGMLMKTIAQELAGEKIRVNAIAPGAIKTEINKAAWGTPAAARKLLKLIPYGRIGEVEDIATAAVWLASDQSDYVTGTTLTIDGGMSLYPSFIGAG